MRGLSPAFIDLFALLVVLFLLLPHLPEVAAEDEARVGSLAVEAHWCDGCRSDVDLWVRSPNDRPVGYSRLRGRHVSLLRDDVGADLENKWRYEIAAAREIPDGEWIVNLHLYRDRDNEAPISVRVSVWTKRVHGARTVLWQGDVTLERNGVEVTAVRFAMTDGDLVPGSIHYSPIALRGRRHEGAIP